MIRFFRFHTVAFMALACSLTLARATVVTPYCGGLGKLSREES